MREVVMQRPPRSFAMPKHASLTTSAAQDPYRSAPASLSITLHDGKLDIGRIAVGIALLCGGVAGLIYSLVHARVWSDLAMSAGFALAGALLLRAIGAFARRIVVEAGELSVRGQHNKVILASPLDRLATITTVQVTVEMQTTFGGVPVARSDAPPIYFVRVGTKDAPPANIARFTDAEAAWWLEDVLRPYLGLGGAAAR